MRCGFVAFGMTLALVGGASAAELPEYYPENYQAIVDAAKEEGKVILYAPLSAKTLGPLISGFEEAYPGVTIELNDLNTVVIYNRYISEAAGGAATADVVWSSALDLQAQLISGGYAMAYDSPEIENLPEWAVWEGNLAFGTTFEPMIFAYNKALLEPDQVPHSHAEVPAKIRENLDVYKGKIATYNVETAGLGFFSVIQDNKFDPEFMEIAKAFGEADARFYSSTGQMVESVASGENVFGYNQPSHAQNYASGAPDFEIVIPEDFVTITSRMMFISKSAANPNAAKLLVDYVLSKPGQQIIQDLNFHSLRSDIEGELSFNALNAEYGDRLKTPQFDESLLEYLDQGKRLEFLSTWNDAVGS